MVIHIGSTTFAKKETWSVGLLAAKLLTDRPICYLNTNAPHCICSCNLLSEALPFLAPLLSWFEAVSASSLAPREARVCSAPWWSAALCRLAPLALSSIFGGLNRACAMFCCILQGRDALQFPVWSMHVHVFFGEQHCRCCTALAVARQQQRCCFAIVLLEYSWSSSLASLPPSNSQSIGGRLAIRKYFFQHLEFHL